MKHMSVFKYSTNDIGYVQCVIKECFKEEFAAMGFVDHIDKVKKPTRRKKVSKDDN